MPPPVELQTTERWLDDLLREPEQHLDDVAIALGATAIASEVRDTG